MQRFNKIKVGDIVVFVFNGGLNNSSFVSISDLTIGRSYKVLSCSVFDSTTDSIMVINDNGREFGYFSIRFMSLSEYRKLKLDKLNSISNV